MCLNNGRLQQTSIKNDSLLVHFFLSFESVVLGTQKKKLTAFHCWSIDNIPLSFWDLMCLNTWLKQSFISRRHGVRTYLESRQFPNCKL